MAKRRFNQSWKFNTRLQRAISRIVTEDEFGKENPWKELDVSLAHKSLSEVARVNDAIQIRSRAYLAASQLGRLELAVQSEINRGYDRIVPDRFEKELRRFAIDQLLDYAWKRAKLDLRDKAFEPRSVTVAEERVCRETRIVLNGAIAKLFQFDQASKSKGE